MGDPVVAARMPLATLRDPYAGFAAIRVDPVHNEVVVMDEFKFNIYVYDRLAVTPATAPATTGSPIAGPGPGAPPPRCCSAVLPRAVLPRAVRSGAAVSHVHDSIISRGNASDDSSRDCRSIPRTGSSLST